MDSVVLFALCLFSLVYSKHIMKDYNKNRKEIKPQKPNTDDTSSLTFEEQFTRMVVKEDPSVTKDEATTFYSILNTYSKPEDKERILEEFDCFIRDIASSKPLHAIQINGFFCGILGSALSLPDSEVKALAKRNSSMILNIMHSHN